MLLLCKSLVHHLLLHMVILILPTKNYETATRNKKKNRAGLLCENLYGCLVHKPKVYHLLANADSIPANQTIWMKQQQEQALIHCLLCAW